jgi:hypothetical protein
LIESLAPASGQACSTPAQQASGGASQMTIVWIILAVGLASTTVLALIEE